MRGLNNIQAITFDIGGTLIGPWPSVGQIYAEAAARQGHKDISAELLKQRFVAAWRAMDDFNHTRAEWARLVDATFEGLTELPPSKTFFSELYEYFGQPAAWRIFPDVLPTLDALATSNLKLGVISNWDERLRPLLRQLSLHDYFEPIIISCEAGCCKPSRIIFEMAAEKIGVPPETILHVGDSPENDVQGAREVGFQAVLLDRAAKIPGNGQILSLRELYPKP